MELRDHLIMQYHSYEAILRNAGIGDFAFTDDQLKEMSLNELQNLVREVREIARTPRD